jgi:hypothetical protein
VMREGMDLYGAAGAAVICAGGLGPSANKARLRRREEARRRRAGAEPPDAATN